MPDGEPTVTACPDVPVVGVGAAGVLVESVPVPVPVPVGAVLLEPPPLVGAPPGVVAPPPVAVPVPDGEPTVTDCPDVPLVVVVVVVPLLVVVVVVPFTVLVTGQVTDFAWMTTPGPKLQLFVVVVVLVGGAGAGDFGVLVGVVASAGAWTTVATGAPGTRGAGT